MQPSNSQITFFDLRLVELCTGLDKSRISDGVCFMWQAQDCFYNGAGRDLGVKSDCVKSLFALNNFIRDSLISMTTERYYSLI